MKRFVMSKKSMALAVTLAASSLLSSCAKTTSQSPDVRAKVTAAVSQAGLADITVAQDQAKGVVTLTGHVASDADKSQAEMVAQAAAGNQVISNQLAVIPPGAEADARKINTALDQGIKNNLEAALVGERLADSVHYSVTNHVVTLTGKVDSDTTRTRANKIAEGVLNVQQVVNEIQVKTQKATTN